MLKIEVTGKGKEWNRIYNICILLKSDSDAL